MWVASALQQLLTFLQQNINVFENTLATTVTSLSLTSSVRIHALNNWAKTSLFLKKSKRKVQWVPQSQTAALPRPQEEEETDKSKQAQTEQTYEKH